MELKLMHVQGNYVDWIHNILDHTEYLKSTHVKEPRALAHYRNMNYTISTLLTMKHDIFKRYNVYNMDNFKEFVRIYLLRNIKTQKFISLCYFESTDNFNNIHINIDTHETGMSVNYNQIIAKCVDLIKSDFPNCSKITIVYKGDLPVILNYLDSNNFLPHRSKPSHYSKNINMEVSL